MRYERARSVSIRRIRTALLILLFTLLFLVFAPSASAQSHDDDILNMSLEELLNLEVTSVSKKAEKRTEAAAAIFVLTNEDIKKSGATNIPDALRLVPGVNVAKLSASLWSVTARGFAGRFANKLLVLIDGRSIYTPLFSGVYWESHDVMLEDIDRIEVIRGPGGTLWGANAVNGVINIVTKRAEDTQGGLISAGAGTEERGFTSVRYGDKIGDKGHYRVYAKYLNRDDSGDTAASGDAYDAWDSGQFGFRTELELSDTDLLTIQGDYVNQNLHQYQTQAYLTAPFSRDVRSSLEYEGHNLLTRWNRTISDESDLQIQLYWDYYRSGGNLLTERRGTTDLSVEHHQRIGEKNDLVWGLGFRSTFDNITNTSFISLNPDKRSDELFSAFIHNDTAISDELHLTLGSKFEHNSYTGFEYQPTARLAWTPNERHTLWGAVSRSVRTPSRVEDDVHIVSTVVAGPTVLALDGTRSFDSEELMAYELGYRAVVTDRLAVDVATFYNDFDNYRSLEPGAPYFDPDPPIPHTVIPFFARNGADAESYGIELVIDWRPKAWWQLRGIYAWQEVDVAAPAGDPLTNTFSGDAPEQTFTLINHFDLPRNIDLDSTLRYVDKLPSLAVDDYLELDLRIAWRPKENIELSLVGQNLLDNGHFEFAPAFVNQIPSQVQRSVYGKVTWEFQPGKRRGKK